MLNSYVTFFNAIILAVARTAQVGAVVALFIFPTLLPQPQVKNPQRDSVDF